MEHEMELETLMEHEMELAEHKNHGSDCITVPMFVLGLILAGEVNLKC